MKTCSVTVQIPEHQMKETATRFIQTANSFKSNLVVTQGANRVNAKSLLGFLSLNPGTGDEVVLTGEGADEAEALKALGAILGRSEA